MLIVRAGILLNSCLAKTSRTFFDFTRGVFELRSGFNIKCGRSKFGLIFIVKHIKNFLMD